MRLDTNETIIGYPILPVRNALRRCGLWFETDELAGFLRIPSEAAADLLAELVQRRWCEQNAQSGWEITSGGMRFLNARAGHPLSREKARTQLNLIIDRATAFCAQFPDWPVRLEKIAVFGSYLTDVDKLGDLDVAIQFTRAGALTTRENIDRVRMVAAESGFRSRSVFDRAGGFISQFVIHTLGNGLRSVSFHEWADLEELACKHEVVWISTATGMSGHPKPSDRS